MTAAVLHEAGNALDGCVSKVRHCADQLTEELVWWRPHESMNSIGNLILHLTGNLRQWMVSGISGAPDVRERPSEFSERGATPKAVLLSGLERVLCETKDVFAQVTADAMLKERRIQGFDVTGWNALFHTVPHFQGHTQEITCFTRMQLKHVYRFHWKPQNSEQGAPATP